MDRPLSGFVYRRVPPHLWNAARREPEERAFVRRAAERGLSVYRADRKRPRQLLAQEIHDRQQQLTSPDPPKRRRALEWLREQGDTPEAYV